MQDAIGLILCGDHNPYNTKRMISLIDNVVVTSSDGTGEEKIKGDSEKKTDIAKDMMAVGRAWDATLIFDENEVKLQYFANEACVKSVTLQNIKNS